MVIIKVSYISQCLQFWGKLFNYLQFWLMLISIHRGITKFSVV